MGKLKEKIEIMKEQTFEKERIRNTIHGLVWNSITYNNEYLEALPLRYSLDIDEFIYCINFELIEFHESMIQAIVYLQGKHYYYLESSDFDNYWIVDEIDECEVEKKIATLRGGIYKGFEIYNPDLPASKKLSNEDDDNDYSDVPF